MKQPASTASHDCMELLDRAQAPIAHFYRLYKRRWFIMVICCAQELVATVLWFGLAPVANFTDEYYQMEGASNALSLVYIAMTGLFSLPAMWFSRRYGLRGALLISSGSQAVGSAVRFGSSWLPPSYRLTVTLVGQAVCAFSNPCMAFMPVKVAGVWFAENERSLTTSILGMVRPAGILLVNALAPALITRVGYVFYANAIYFAAALCTLLCVGVTVRSSAPPSPPTASAAKRTMPFAKGMKSCLTSINFYTLAIPLGGGIGWFNAVYTISQQLLCPTGYSNAFVGLNGSIMIIAGVSGAVACGIFLDRTKLFDEATKVVYSLCAIFSFGMSISALRPNLHLPILCFTALFGFFGMAGYPAGLQMIVETTYPVDETTSNGLIVLIAQIFGTLFVMVFSKLKRPLDGRYKFLQLCTRVDSNTVVVAHDMSVPVLFGCACLFAFVCILICCFRPTYERSKEDAKRVETTILQKESMII